MGWQSVSRQPETLGTRRNVVLPGAGNNGVPALERPTRAVLISSTHTGGVDASAYDRVASVDDVELEPTVSAGRVRRTQDPRVRPEMDPPIRVARHALAIGQPGVVRKLGIEREVGSSAQLLVWPGCAKGATAGKGVAVKSRRASVNASCATVRQPGQAAVAARYVIDVRHQAANRKSQNTRDPRRPPEGRASSEPVSRPDAPPGNKLTRALT